MDEEYDIIVLGKIKGIALCGADTTRHGLDRMSSFRPPQRRGKEGPPPRPQPVLWRVLPKEKNSILSVTLTGRVPV